MCGRYGLSAPARVAELGLDASLLADVLAAAPRWNIAPSQRVPAVVADRDGVRAATLQWGLVPAWASDPSIGNRLANARGETVRTKPAFRQSFAGRRALVFADLFYEWQAVPGARRKQPWCIRLDGDAPFAFAALWDSWPRGSLHTFTLITTSPNAVVAPIHDRMPVILPAEAFATWLDVSAPKDDVEALLLPHDAAAMHAVRVSTRVNAPTHDAPDCIAPLTDDAP